MLVASQASWSAGLGRDKGSTVIGGGGLDDRGLAGSANPRCCDCWDLLAQPDQPERGGQHQSSP